MIDSIQSWCGVGLYALHIIFLILILNLNAEILCGENPCLNNSTCFSTPNTASCRCTKGMFKVLHCPLIGKITLTGTIYHNLFTKCWYLSNLFCRDCLNLLILTKSKDFFKYYSQYYNQYWVQYSEIFRKRAENLL